MVNLKQILTLLLVAFVIKAIESKPAESKHGKSSIIYLFKLFVIVYTTFMGTIFKEDEKALFSRRFRRSDSSKQADMLMSAYNRVINQCTGGNSCKKALTKFMANLERIQVAKENSLKNKKPVRWGWTQEPKKIFYFNFR